MRLRNPQIPRLTRQLLGLFCVVAIPGIAIADVVTLNNGTRFRGILTGTSPGDVTIQADSAEWTFRPDQVASVEREEPGRTIEAEKERKARLEASKPRPVPVKKPQGDFGAKRDGSAGAGRHHHGHRR